MKLTYLFFILAILPLCVNSQQNNVSGNYDGRSNSSEWAIKTREAYADLRSKINKTLSDYEIEEILGNAYYNKEFVYGKVFVDHKEVSDDLAFRYNAFTDEIEVRKGETVEVIVKNPKISCLIGKDLFIYHPFVKKENGKIYNGYLKTILQGDKFSLFERKIKIYKEPKEAKSTFTTSFPAKLVDVQEFYYLDKQNVNAVLITQKNKKILDLIDPKVKSEMSKFMKEKKLNIKNKEDLIIVFRYYNNLVNGK